MAILFFEIAINLAKLFVTSERSNKFKKNIVLKCVVVTDTFQLKERNDIDSVSGSTVFYTNSYLADTEAIVWRIALISYRQKSRNCIVLPNCTKIARHGEKILPHDPELRTNRRAQPRRHREVPRRLLRGRRPRLALNLEHHGGGKFASAEAALDRIIVGARLSRIQSVTRHLQHAACRRAPCRQITVRWRESSRGRREGLREHCRGCHNGPNHRYKNGQSHT
jgi:hypothetical protein